MFGDAVNRAHYRVDVSSPAQVNEVAAVVNSVAAEVGYVRADWPEWIPGGVAFYKAPARDEHHSYVGMQATADSVIVAFEGDVGSKIPRLDRARRRILSSLRKKLGAARVTEEGAWNYSLVYRPVKKREH